jgi:chromosome segregation ATPase
MLERIGVDPELFRYQIRMNSREGGAAEPFLFKNDENFVDFFLELMGEAATGHEIAKNIATFRQSLFDLRHKLEPEYALLQTLTHRLALLCEVADERERLYGRIHSVREGIDDATGAVNRWVENLQQERSTWEEIEKEAHTELLRVQEAARQQRRRALLLRYAASQKRVQQLTTDVATLRDLVEYAKRQVIVWQAAIPLRTMIRARARAESI